MAMAPSPASRHRLTSSRCTFVSPHLASLIFFHMTFQSIENLSVSQRELLSTIRDGTFFLHTFKARFDPGFSELCPFCSQSLDTMEHRACVCSYFQSVRERHATCWTMWSDVPVALSHHGWTPANEWIPRFHDELERLIDAPVSWQCEPAGRDVQHIFTDGPCQLPTHPIGQLSSWAFELANSTQTVASGLLPGRWQGIARAELYAVLQSLLWAAFHVVPIHIYSDSAFVVRRLERLLAGHVVSWSWAHADLWERIVQCLPQVPWLQVTKVTSHLNIEHAGSSFEVWCIHHNSVADLAAAAARLTALPSSLRMAYDAMMEMHAAHYRLSRQFQLFLLDLAEHGLAAELSAQPEPCTDSFVFSSFLVNDQGFVEDQPLDVRSALQKNLFLQRFGIQFAEALQSWLVSLSLQAEYLTPVSFVEIFLGFSVCTKVSLPICVDSTSQHWMDVAALEAGDLFGRTLAAQVSTFRLLFDALLQAVDCSFETWPVLVADKVHLSTLAFCRRSPLRFSRDLARSWP